MAETPPPGSKLSANELEQMATPEDTIRKAAEALGGRVVNVTDGDKGVQPPQDGEPAKTEEADPEPKEEEFEVEEADRKEYIRTLLNGERFTKSYEIFGGAVKLTFQSRTVAENKEIVDKEVDEVEGERLAMLTSMVEIKMGGQDATKPDSLEFFDNMGDIMYVGVLYRFRHFERVCDEMFNKASDADFWNPTGGRS